VCIENVGFMAGHEGQRLKVARPEFEEGSVQQAAWRQEWKGSEFRGRPGVSPADACAGLCASGGTGGRLRSRVTLGSSGTYMSLERGSYGSWHRTGGSRCCTGYTRSWPGPRKASCRNTSPGPTSRHLRRQERAYNESKYGHS